MQFKNGAVVVSLGCRDGDIVTVGSYVAVSAAGAIRRKIGVQQQCRDCDIALVMSML